MSDLQSLADAKGITLDESIALYAWRDDFSRMVTAIEDDDPDSVVGAGKTGGSSAWIKVFGFHPRQRPECHRTNSSPKTLTLRSAYKQAETQGSPSGEADAAVVGAHLAVMAEDGVQGSVTYYDSDAIEIVVTVQMATPPSR